MLSNVFKKQISIFLIQQRKRILCHVVSILFFTVFTLIYLVSMASGSRTLTTLGREIISLSRTVKKSVRYCSHVTFLNACLREGVIPKGMSYSFAKDALPQSAFVRNHVNEMIQYASRETVTTCRDTYATLAEKENQNMQQCLYRIFQICSDHQQFEDIRSKHLMTLHNMQRQENRRKKKKLDSLIRDKPQKPSTLENEIPKKKRNRRFKSRAAKKNHSTGDEEVVVNLSSVILTDAQKRVLALGPKFCPTPTSLDSKRLSEDVREGCRYTRLRELHYKPDAPADNDGPPKFYKKTGYCPPVGRDKALDAFCHMIQHRTDAYTNLSRKKSNLTQEQRRAVKELKTLVEDRRIRISSADKGGATVVQNTEDYIREAMQQLSNTKHYVQLQSDPTPKIAKASNEITDQLFADGHISEQTHRWAKLNVSQTKCHKFYTLPKIHKTLNNPPGRPIVSGINGPTENLSKIVDSWLQPYVTSLQSHIKDSTHMLMILEKWNQDYGPFPDNTRLVTIDVTALYTSIPHDDMKEAVRYFLSKQTEPDTPPSEVVVGVADHVLQNNVFSFEGKTFKQVLGTAMGTPMAPTGANLFMGMLEERLLDQSPVPVNREFWKRFIDDILMLWTGSLEELDVFINHMNSFHPTIKFTANSSVDTVPFLDINITLKDGFLRTDLYSKPTDAHSYLHSSSSHPRHTVNNIPYSLFIRLRRLCSTPDVFSSRCQELSQQLKYRGYKEKVISEARQKAESIPRSESLEYKSKKKNSRVPFVVTHNPANPPLRTWLRELHEVMARDSDRMRGAVPEPPVVGERNCRSLKTLLMPTCLPEKKDGRPPGVYKCEATRCTMCSKHLVQGTSLSSHQTGEVFQHRTALSCTTANVIYVLWCDLCMNTQYVGETMTPLKKRFYQHYQDIRTNKGTMVTRHFNLPGHSMDNMRVMPLEKVYCAPEDHCRRLQREAFWMSKLRTTYPLGLNTKD